MKNTINEQVAAELVHEYDFVLRQYLHMTLEEVVTELHKIGISSYSEPIDLLSDVRISAILYISSDPEVQRLQKAIERVAGGSYGRCANCSVRISDEVLLEDPKSELCYICTLRRQLITAEIENDTEAYKRCI